MSDVEARGQRIAQNAIRLITVEGQSAQTMREVYHLTVLQIVIDGMSYPEDVKEAAQKYICLKILEKTQGNPEVTVSKIEHIQ